MTDLVLKGILYVSKISSLIYSEQQIARQLRLQKGILNCNLIEGQNNKMGLFTEAICHQKPETFSKLRS